jgi:hypothetical protein
MMRVIVSFDDFVFKYDDLDEAPRALIFSDAPTLGQDGLPYAVVPFSPTPVQVTVPAGPATRCVTVQCVAATRADFGGLTLNMCGKAEFPELGHTPQRRKLLAREAKDYIHGSVQLALAADQQPWTPLLEAARVARCTQLAHEATWWYTSSFKSLFGGGSAYPPLDPNLKKMHIEYLDFPKSGIPTAFFMYHAPRWGDSEVMLVATAAAAGARMGWTPERVATMAASALRDINPAASRHGASGDYPQPDTVRFAILVGAIETRPD